VSSGFDVVLPYPNHPDSVTTQQATDLPITLSVPSDLQSPERRVLTGGSKALRTAVPETSVDKNSDPPVSKVKIRLPHNVRRMKCPAAKSGASEKSRERQLRATVSAWPNCGHHRRALLLAEHVHCVSSRSSGGRVLPDTPPTIEHRQATAPAQARTSYAFPFLPLTDPINVRTTAVKTGGHTALPSNLTLSRLVPCSSR
jgi:hypothetical protein